MPMLGIMHAGHQELCGAASLLWSLRVLGQNINSAVALGIELISSKCQLPPLKNETNTCPAECLSIQYY